MEERGAELAMAPQQRSPIVRRAITRADCVLDKLASAGSAVFIRLDVHIDGYVLLPRLTVALACVDTVGSAPTSVDIRPVTPRLLAPTSRPYGRLRATTAFRAVTTTAAAA